MVETAPNVFEYEARAKSIRGNEHTIIARGQGLFQINWANDITYAQLYADMRLGTSLNHITIDVQTGTFAGMLRIVSTVRKVRRANNNTEVISCNSHTSWH